MPKCPVCVASLPKGVEYCPPKKLLEHKNRVYKFRGCYLLRTEELRKLKGCKRMVPM